MFISDELIIPRNNMETYLIFKKDNIEPPGFYLEYKFEWNVPKGTTIWTMTIHDYVKEAINNLEQKLNNNGGKLPNEAVTWCLKTVHLI